jgi:hypothetical protein
MSRSFAGVAMQVGRHELGAAYLLSDKMKFGGFLHYRYYLAPNQWRVQPYVGFIAVRDKKMYMTYNGSGGQTVVGTIAFAGLTFGAEFALAPGFSFYFQHSVGISRVAVQRENIGRGMWDGIAQLGIRGTLRVAGDAAERSWQRSADFAQGRRLFINVMASGRPAALDSRLVPASSGTLNFGAEYRLSDFLRPYAGISYGFIGPFAYQNWSNVPQTVGINGLQTGMRFYTFTRPRCAIFQDVGGSYSNNKRFDYHDSRFWIGQGISLHVVKGIYATGLMRFNIGVRGGYADMGVGLSVAPFAWRK